MCSHTGTLTASGRGTFTGRLWPFPGSLFRLGGDASRNIRSSRLSFAFISVKEQSYIQKKIYRRL